MTLGLSLFLIAVGAILAFAVHYSFFWINITAVGVILMVIGLLGTVLSLLIWSSLYPFGEHHEVREHHGPPHHSHR